LGFMVCDPDEATSMALAMPPGDSAWRWRSWEAQMLDVPVMGRSRGAVGESGAAHDGASGSHAWNRKVLQRA